MARVAWASKDEPESGCPLTGGNDLAVASKCLRVDERSRDDPAIGGCPAIKQKRAPETLETPNRTTRQATCARADAPATRGAPASAGCRSASRDPRCASPARAPPSPSAHIACSPGLRRSSDSAGLMKRRTQAHNNLNEIALSTSRARPQHLSSKICWFNAAQSHTVSAQCPPDEVNLEQAAYVFASSRCVEGISIRAAGALQSVAPNASRRSLCVRCWAGDARGLLERKSAMREVRRRARAARKRCAAKRPVRASGARAAKHRRSSGAPTVRPSGAPERQTRATHAQGGGRAAPERPSHAMRRPLHPGAP